MKLRKIWKKTDGKNLPGKADFREFRKKQLKNGSYSMIVTVIFLAAVILINLIVGELPAKYSQIDVSEQKLYSIGDETEKVLKDLEKDVTIYQIAQNGNEDENIWSLLERYADETDHIRIEQKDPVVNPGFVSEYTDEDLSENSLIVVSGERSKVISYDKMYESSLDYNTFSYQTTGFDGEGQITSAVSYVTMENLPVLYTLEGHGEMELDSTITDSIEKMNIEIKSLNLLTEGSVPEDADCLMINSPGSDISEDEKTAILEYLEDGGKAMIFSDYTGTVMENLNAVLENYGVERVDGLVFEGDNQHYAMQMPYYLVPEVSSAEAAGDVASSGYYILAPYGQGILRTDETRDTLTIESILTTSDEAYSKTDINDGKMEKESSDTDGPFDLGVSITETLSDDKETKIVYYSTSAILDSQVNQMVSGGNYKLITSSMNWLTDTEEAENVSIPVKSLEVSYLTMTDYDASFWKICTMGIIPGFFLVAGFMIWLKRRKA